MDDQRKRTMEAIERMCAQLEAEHHAKQKKGKPQPIEDSEKVTTDVESLIPNKAQKRPSSGASSRKGNISFKGHTTEQDVKVNEPAYLDLSYPVHENLLPMPTGVQDSNRKTAVDRILHQLFQHGDSAQKYMQGSKSMKIDNHILLDNFVPKSVSSGTHIQALRSHSKRSKKHMSRRQHKKCGTFNLPHEVLKFETFKPMHHKWKTRIQSLISVGENQLAQCLLNDYLEGAHILVVQCKIVSYIGVSGIIIRETKETLGIITEDNKFQVVPKKLSVFMFQVDCWKITLHGDKLTSRNLTA